MTNPFSQLNRDQILTLKVYFTGTIEYADPLLSSTQLKKRQARNALRLEIILLLKEALNKLEDNDGTRN